MRISQYFATEEEALAYKMQKDSEGDARFETAFLRPNGSYGLVYWSTSPSGPDEEFQP